MQLVPENYYHIYNRSNNHEIVFKETENYQYFLEKYQKYISSHVDTIAYCLMPTHFHFCISVKNNDSNILNDSFGILLSSYTKAINKRFKRNGSLFQKHTKAIEIDDESYLLTLCTYIHQNPVRAKLVEKQEEWYFSSYNDYTARRSESLVSKNVLLQYFKTSDEFKQYSEEIITTVHQKYWI